MLRHEAFFVVSVAEEIGFAFVFYGYGICFGIMVSMEKNLPVRNNFFEKVMF